MWSGGKGRLQFREGVPRPSPGDAFPGLPNVRSLLSLSRTHSLRQRSYVDFPKLYSLSQAGNRPLATEWPFGKSSSISPPGKFLSTPRPRLWSSGTPKSQRIPQAPGKLKSRPPQPSGVQRLREACERKTTPPSGPRASQCAGVAAPRHPSPSSNCSPRSVPVFPPSVLMSPLSLRHLTLTANSRRRVQPLRLLQEAECPVGLVALDGLEGDANTALGFILVGFHGGTRARNQGGGGRASGGLRQPPARRGAGGRRLMT